MPLSRLWQEAVSSSKWHSVVYMFRTVQHLVMWPWLLHLVDTSLYIQAISLETKCPSAHVIIDLFLYLHVPSVLLWFAKNTPYVFEIYFHITEQEKKFVLRDVLKGTHVYTDIQEEYVSSILVIETAGVFHKIFLLHICSCISNQLMKELKFILHYVDWRNKSRH